MCAQMFFIQLTNLTINDNVDLNAGSAVKEGDRGSVEEGGLWSSDG